MDITKLPFNEFIGIERDSREEFVLRLPSSERYANHLGTVHASALMALAEATSGEKLLLQMDSPASGIIPVVRRFECKFRKPAVGAVSSKANISENSLAELKDSLLKKGRGSIEVAVDLYDDSDTHVMACSVDWFIATTT